MSPFKDMWIPSNQSSVFFTGPIMPLHSIPYHFTEVILTLFYSTDTNTWAKWDTLTVPELEELGIKLPLLYTSGPELHISYRKVMECLENADWLILLEGKSLNVCTFNSITGMTILVALLISGIIKLLELMTLLSSKNGVGGEDPMDGKLYF